VDLSAEWLALHPLIWKASVSRNYRVPTLNDLHWEPGGNPDLVPERGWTLESGFHLDDVHNQMKWKASLTCYSRKIDQWIMWMPPVKGVSLYWSPINITEVNSRGLEWRLDWSTAMDPFQLNLKNAIDLTWSTFGAPLPDFGIASGDQLFYVPRENYMAGIEIKFHSLGFGYTHHWFGPSPGINEDLKGGNVASLHIEFTLDRNDWQSTFYVLADNLWDTPYRLIERRPMPGRALELGGRIRIR
jgi:iron complex outermembrane receptor protein